MGFDFYHDCSPTIWLRLLLCLWMWVFFFFFGKVLHPPVNGYSTASCDFEALAGGDEYMSICSILNWKIHLDHLEDYLC